MLGEKLAQSVEPAFPGLPLLFHPLLNRPHRHRFKTTGSHPPDLLRTDETTRFQHLQMLDDRRQGHVERTSQFTDRRRSPTEPFNHAAPGRIRERLKFRIERLLIVKHILKY